MSQVESISNQIEELFKQNGSKYRTVLQNLQASKTACIPFLGLHLSDLIFIHEGKTFSGDSKEKFRVSDKKSASTRFINYSKFRNQSDTIFLLQQLQSTKYSLTFSFDKFLYSNLLHVSGFSEEELEDMVKEIVEGKPVKEKNFPPSKTLNEIPFSAHSKSNAYILKFREQAKELPPNRIHMIGLWNAFLMRTCTAKSLFSSYGSKSKSNPSSPRTPNTPSISSIQNSPAKVLSASTPQLNRASDTQSKHASLFIVNCQQVEDSLKLLFNRSEALELLVKGFFSEWPSSPSELKQIKLLFSNALQLSESENTDLMELLSFCHHNKSKLSEENISQICKMIGFHNRLRDFVESESILASLDLNALKEEKDINSKSFMLAQFSIPFDDDGTERKKVLESVGEFPLDSERLKQKLFGDLCAEEENLVNEICELEKSFKELEQVEKEESPSISADDLDSLRRQRYEKTRYIAGEIKSGVARIEEEVKKKALELNLLKEKIENCKSELEILRPKLKLMDYFLSHFFLSLRERLRNTLLQETSLENSRNHFEKELVKILEWISPQVSSQSLEKERKESLLKQVDFLWNCISRMHPTYSQDKLKTFLEELNSFENTLNSKKKVYNSNSVQSLSNNPEKPLELAKESFTFEYTPTLKSKDK